ncbi:histidine phosphatase family protein [Candidatus Frankia alpina]|uniref:Histidine phosphatase family protein n=1 Tax=Candidatus Frankia alpina TaxID=2699483 RepID=A0A4S5ET36_9ACTN|nr:histidine phosphatase family protein [Candidatus Frankia alpina]THJ75638.1 histidine phosphatase family protein [Candidatus Frankia alpina]
MSPQVPPGRVVLLRHGETEWSRLGRHTGSTDVDLTAEGERQAAGQAARLSTWSFDLVVTSTRVRARRTADLAGLVATPETGREVWDDLAEWDYGRYEGITTATIRESVPGWTVWTAPVPGGETAEQVAARADAVLGRLRPWLEHGDVALVGHGHMLRVLVARWLGLPPRAGAYFVLAAGGLSMLGHEHEEPVVETLNLPA